MGMFFGGLDEDENNQPPADNFVYKQLKKARYRGIELSEGDIITPDKYDGQCFLIRDFKENGQPIVDIVTTQRHEDWNFPYEFDTLFVVKPKLTRIRLMTSVSYKIFEEFVKKNNLVKIRGKWFHSFDYMDNKGFIKATEESSSWGGGDSYLIDSEEAENLNTLEFVNNIINGK